MKLIIDVDKQTFDKLTEYGEPLSAGNGFHDSILKAVANGIPLPKGHGELIDKDVVLDMMNHGILEDYITTMDGIIPAEPERPQGEWVWLGDNPNSDHKWSCNQCGRGVKEQENFCPHCGADMIRIRLR